MSHQCGCPKGDKVAEKNGDKQIGCKPWASNQIEQYQEDTNENHPVDSKSVGFSNGGHILCSNSKPINFGINDSGSASSDRQLFSSPITKAIQSRQARKFEGVSFKNNFEPCDIFEFVFFAPFAVHKGCQIIFASNPHDLVINSSQHIGPELFKDALRIFINALGFFNRHAQRLS